MEKENLRENIAWNYIEPTPLVEQVFEKGIITAGDLVLDAGCGFGRNTNWLASKDVQVVGIDLDEKALEEARKRAEDLGVSVDYRKASVAELPFENDSFDSVIDSGCTHQLSRDDQGRASGELARVLKPSGFVVYFGFSKDHPAAPEEIEDPTYRDIDQVLKIFGENFEVVGSNQVSWKPKPEERANFAEHVGISAVLRKKASK